MHDLRHISFAIAVAILASIGNARAQTAAPTTAPATMPALSPHDLDLLHQLESGTWRQRKEAENELINAGAWEVPAIDQMLAITTSPDAKARLVALRRRLVHDRALGPSPITLHMKDAPAKAVYAELFHQAWAPLLTAPGNLLDDPTLPRITIDADHKPFWLIMRDLQRTTGLGLASEPDGYRLRRGGRIARGPVTISGPFLVVLADVRHDILNPQQYWADCTVYAEPKVHFLGLDPNVQLALAKDNHGDAMPPTGQAMAVPPDLDYGPQQFSVCFFAPNANGRSLSHLKASTTASIAIQSEHLDIPDLLGAKPRFIESGGVTLNFVRCKKSGSIYEISFACQQDPWDQFQKINVDHPGWQVRVLDSDGEVLPRAEAVVTNDANTSQLTLIYGPKIYGKPIPAPQRLVWEVPSEIQVVDLPVDFGDISVPLPGF